ncbi:MAG: hypothetical protein GY938_20095 [Ketobacter sp.]|nr:hypothetical protein [Ketobacter sp.]
MAFCDKISQNEGMPFFADCIAFVAMVQLNIELSQSVHQELSTLLGIKGSPVVSRTHHWPRGLPQYTLGHENRRKIIETAHQRLPGLFLTGNFLKGVSIINCLDSAKTTTSRVHTSLNIKAETGK